MKMQLVVAAALLSVPLAAMAADGTFERTLNTSAQPDVYVSTGSGNVHVKPSVSGAGAVLSGNSSTALPCVVGSGCVRIVGHVHAGWSAFGDVDARIRRIVDNPPIEQEGNTVRIGDPADRSLFNNISIDYEISVPVDAALNVHSGSGDVVIDQVGRFVAGASGSGNVSLHGVHGPAELQSGSGDLELDSDGSGDVKARTGSGNIQIHGWNGALIAKTGSGDITADGHLQGAATITSGSGDVKLRLTPDSHFTLEASTGSGDIKLHMPGLMAANTDSSKHHLTTAVNGGGPTLEIHTGSGDIEINPR